jgi:biopolymer transport protein TolR
MAMQVGGTSELNSEINVTPMVDVMLVLLIIFMIVTPLLQAGVSVNLPRDMISAEEDADIAKDTSVVIAVPCREGTPSEAQQCDASSNFYIGKNPFPLDTLGAEIKRRLEGKTPDKRIVYIKSDNRIDYGRVVQLVETVRKQDVDKIGLVADRKKGPQAPKT